MIAFVFLVAFWGCSFFAFVIAFVFLVAFCDCFFFAFFCFFFQDAKLLEQRGLADTNLHSDTAVVSACPISLYFKSTLLLHMCIANGKGFYFTGSVCNGGST